MLPIKHNTTQNEKSTKQRIVLCEGKSVVVEAHNTTQHPSTQLCVVLKPVLKLTNNCVHVDTMQRNKIVESVLCFVM